MIHERLVGSDSFDLGDERVDYYRVDADAPAAGDYLELVGEGRAKSAIGSARASGVSPVGCVDLVLVDNGIVTPEEVRHARFGRAVWRGYRRASVVELLERAAIQLEAHQSPATLIAGTKLEMERWGYRRSEVDRFLFHLHRDRGDEVRNPATGRPRRGRREWWRDLIALYGVLLVVGLIFRGSWVGYVVGGIAIVIFVVMLRWRRRSGIETWTFMSTVAGLVTGVRPSREGLVRSSGPSEPRGHRPEGQSFDAMAHLLHEIVQEPPGDREHPDP